MCFLVPEIDSVEKMKKFIEDDDASIVGKSHVSCVYIYIHVCIMYILMYYVCIY